MANVIMDDGLNIVTQVTDTQILTQKVGSDGTLYINTINSNNNSDLPAGSYHFSTGVDKTSFNGVLTNEDGDLVPGLAIYDNISGSFSVLFLTPTDTQIITENLYINEIVTITGVYNIMGATFSIQNGLIIEIIT